MLRIERLDGGVLVIEAGRIATTFAAAPRFGQFQAAAGTTSPNTITEYDIGLLNRLMTARTPYARWAPILNKYPQWLKRIDERYEVERRVGLYAEYRLTGG